jgi:hypothetical protein
MRVMAAMSPEDGQSAPACPPAQYLTRQQLAARSGLSASTVQRYKEQNLIPYFQPGGKGARVLFPMGAVEAASATAKLQKLTATGQAIDADLPRVRKSPLAGRSPRWMNNPINQESEPKNAQESD